MRRRTLTATTMALRDESRRPLVLILLIVIPAYVVVRSIAVTEATPRTVELPGEALITVTMKEVHGAVMAGNVTAFVSALVGAFVVQSAREGDRRLVIAGFSPVEAISARVAVILAADVVVIAVSAAATAVSFDIASWGPFLLGLVFTALVYSALGSLIGVLLDRLTAVYLILFLALVDLGVVQNPMFGSPGELAFLLPGYAPNLIMLEGAFTSSFGAWSELALSVGWVALAGTAFVLSLRRSVAPQR